MSPNFRRSSPSRRTADRARRELRKRLLIVCGGVKTEKDYFHGMRDHFRSPNVTIKVDTDARSPLHVVRKAASSFRNNSDDFDECWAVFDVDDFDVSTAVAEAKRGNVNLAISNPCFEYWLLLHFCEHPGSITTRNALINVRKHLPNYDKTRLRFSDYADGVEEAVVRAEIRDRGNSSEPGVNPSTRVWRIVEQVTAKQTS
ncbi:RloB family protein [Streptomyces specialis]|uniref:RloB family protein n=1 Tax=Streptomyces specialis TaxID=498367 RepID=UPI00131CABC7